jgi:hypothetical protein
VCLLFLLRSTTLPIRKYSVFFKKIQCCPYSLVQFGLLKSDRLLHVAGLNVSQKKLTLLKALDFEDASL